LQAAQSACDAVALYRQRRRVRARERAVRLTFRCPWAREGDGLAAVHLDGCDSQLGGVVRDLGRRGGPVQQPWMHAHHRAHAGTPQCNHTSCTPPAWARRSWAPPRPAPSPHPQPPPALQAGCLWRGRQRCGQLVCESCIARGCSRTPLGRSWHQRMAAGWLKRAALCGCGDPCPCAAMPLARWAPSTHYIHAAAAAAQGTSVGSRTLELWSAVCIAAVFEFRWACSGRTALAAAVRPGACGWRRGGVTGTPCWWQPARRLSERRVSPLALTRCGAPPCACSGAMLLGQSVLSTIVSGIASPAAFADMPAVYMFGMVSAHDRAACGRQRVAAASVRGSACACPPRPHSPARPPARPPAADR